MGYTRDYSDKIAETIDAEVRKLIEQAHDEAWQVLNTNRDMLDTLATELLEKETLDHDELAEIFKKVEKLPERPQWLSSEASPVSDRPPWRCHRRLPIDAGIVDGGVESETPPKRTAAAAAQDARHRDRLSRPRARGWPSTPVASRRPSPNSSPQSARIRPGRVSRAPRSASPRRTRDSSRASVRTRSSTSPTSTNSTASPASSCCCATSSSARSASTTCCRSSGRAHVAYVPDRRIVGLGKLPRVVETLASRPQLQERLTEEIADALVAGLSPKGVLVVLDAVHGCVSARGPRQATSSTVTVATRGTLADPVERAGVLALIGSGGHA